MERIFWGGVEEAGTTIVKGSVLLVLSAVSVVILDLITYFLGAGFTASDWVDSLELGWLGRFLFLLAPVAVTAGLLYWGLYKAVSWLRKKNSERKADEQPTTNT